MKNCTKKIMILFFSLLFSSSFVFAQYDEAAYEEDAIFYGGEFAFRLGGFFNYDVSPGDMIQFSWCDLGGGLAAEFDFPIVLPDSAPTFWMFLQTLGASLNVEFNGNVIRSELLDLAWNTRITCGVHFQIPFGTSGFSFYPQLNAGIALYFPWINTEYYNELQPVYVDQLYGIDLGFRYSNNELLYGRLEFGIAPFYSISPEKDGAVHNLGVKIGVYFKIV